MPGCRFRRAHGRPQGVVLNLKMSLESFGKPLECSGEPLEGFGRQFSRKIAGCRNHMILLCKRVRLEAFLFIPTGLQILEGPWKPPGGGFEAENEFWKALESTWRVPENSGGL